MNRVSNENLISKIAGNYLDNDMKSNKEEPMRMTEEGIKFLKEHESLRTKSYQDLGKNKRINEGNFDEAFNTEMTRWIHSQGKKIKGLVNRRAAEQKLALTPYKPYALSMALPSDYGMDEFPEGFTTGE